MTLAMRTMLMQFYNMVLVRYIGASAIALASDIAVFTLCMMALVHPALASAIGYSFGIGVHWLVSSRAVFTDTVAPRGMARTKQKTLFALSAFAGLAITIGIVWAGEQVGSHAFVSKAAAIIVSFCAVYIIRKQIIFR